MQHPPRPTPLARLICLGLVGLGLQLAACTRAPEPPPPAGTAAPVATEPNLDPATACVPSFARVTIEGSEGHQSTGLHRRGDETMLTIHDGTNASALTVNFESGLVEPNQRNASRFGLPISASYRGRYFNFFSTPEPHVFELDTDTIYAAVVPVDWPQGPAAMSAGPTGLSAVVPTEEGNWLIEDVTGPAPSRVPLNPDPDRPLRGAPAVAVGPMVTIVIQKRSVGEQEVAELVVVPHVGPMTVREIERSESLGPVAVATTTTGFSVVITEGTSLRTIPLTHEGATRVAFEDQVTLPSPVRQIDVANLGGETLVFAQTIDEATYALGGHARLPSPLFTGETVEHVTQLGELGDGEVGFVTRLNDPQLPIDQRQLTVVRLSCSTEQAPAAPLP